MILNKEIFNCDFEFKGKEKDLELYVMENIHDISLNRNWGNIVNVESQFPVNLTKGRIFADVMLWHENGSGTVIEIKRSNTNRNDVLTAISQLLFYGQRLEEKWGAMPRLVVCCPEISMDSYDVIKRFNLPINILMIDGDRCLYLT